MLQKKKKIDNTDKERATEKQRKKYKDSRENVLSLCLFCRISSFFLPFLLPVITLYLLLFPEGGNETDMGNSNISGGCTQ